MKLSRGCRRSCGEQLVDAEPGRAAVQTAARVAKASLPSEAAELPALLSRGDWQLERSLDGAALREGYLKDTPVATGPIC